MSKPKFIIVGETKCGSTSLFNYLKLHPLIKESYGNGQNYHESYRTKEIRFFDKYFELGENWYFSRFPRLEDEEITGEATPMYFYRTLAASRIASLLPEIKLIVLLRNPIDRLVSNFYHNFRWVKGWKEKYPDIQTYFYSCQDSDYYLIEKGLYLNSLKNWLQYFDLNQFHIIKSEDMFQNPSIVYNQVLDFLDLPPFGINNFEIFRSNEYSKLDTEFRRELGLFYVPHVQKLEKFLNKQMNWIL